MVRFTIKIFFIVVFCVYGLYDASAQRTVWVGQTVTCDAASAVMGLTSDISWSSNGVLSMTGSGFYRDVTATRYFGGVGTVTCSWKYRLYYSDTPKTMRKSWSFYCYDNPVYITPSSQKIAVGQSFYVGASLKYSNSYSNYADISFSSSKSSVATVSSSGCVKGISPGTAYINVYSTVSANSPYCTVTVEVIDPKSISLSPDPLRVTESFSKQLTATMTPDFASSKLTWTVSDPEIASVSSTGLVSGLSVGKTKVTVKTQNGLSASAVIEVCPQPSAVKLPDTQNVYVGYNITLKPVVTPEYSETKYTWKSSDNTIATVSTSGKIFGKKEGSATIYVTSSNNLTDSTSVSVILPDEALSAEKIESMFKSLKDLVSVIKNKIQ